MSDKIFREEQSDGSFKQYDVSKFSEEGQRFFYLLERLAQKKQDVSDTWLMLKESEDGLIAKIKSELSDEMLLELDDEEGKDS